MEPRMRNRSDAIKPPIRKTMDIKIDEKKSIEEEKKKEEIKIEVKNENQVESEQIQKLDLMENFKLLFNTSHLKKWTFNPKSPWGLVGNEKDQINEALIIAKYHFKNFQLENYLPFIFTRNLKQVSTGKSHLILLTDDNQILTYGKTNFLL